MLVALFLVDNSLDSLTIGHVLQKKMLLRPLLRWIQRRQSSRYEEQSLPCICGFRML